MSPESIVGIGRNIEHPADVRRGLLAPPDDPRCGQGRRVHDESDGASAGLEIECMCDFVTFFHGSFLVLRVVIPQNTP